MVSEAMIVRQNWQDDVGIAEKVDNLHNENGKMSALAGAMAVDNLHLAEVQKQAYIDFCYYAGILQGMKVNGYAVEDPLAYEKFMEKCENILLEIPMFAQHLEELVLDKLVESYEEKYQEKNGGYHQQEPATQGFEVG